jgi:uncharacterized protein GlcG (DUF336 family)
MAPPELLESRVAPSALAPLSHLRNAIDDAASAGLVGRAPANDGCDDLSIDDRAASLRRLSLTSDSSFVVNASRLSRADGEDQVARRSESGDAEPPRGSYRPGLARSSGIDAGDWSAFDRFALISGESIDDAVTAPEKAAAQVALRRQPYAVEGGGAGAAARPSGGVGAAGGGDSGRGAPSDSNRDVDGAAMAVMAPPLAVASTAELVTPPGGAGASADWMQPAVISPVPAITTSPPTSTSSVSLTFAPTVVSPLQLVAPPIIGDGANSDSSPEPPPAPASAPVSTLADPGQITDAEVVQLLNRAAMATARTDAIIAVVDRNGRILGVRVEGGVTIADEPTLVYAIDGAVAKARTAAFFSSDMAPLTSRTIRFISQSTITEREVESNPTSTGATTRGPGFVAPIGLGGHFPPDVANTPHVDLFAIEHTNRDSLVHPGADRIKQPVVLNADGTVSSTSGGDIDLGTRFSADFIAGQEIDAPESYGFVSDRLTEAQNRGIATLPGGVPLYKVEPAGTAPRLVGGLGVFFPGTNGDATFEQGFVPGVGQSTAARTNAPLVLEAEYTAAIVAANTTTIGGLPPVAGFVLPEGRIDLVGITLESIGPHPTTRAQFLATPYVQGALTGSLQQVAPDPGILALGGENVPDGWLVAPKASSAPGGLTAAEVEDIINRGVAEANLVRAAIRLPLGSRTRMVLSVTDLDGEVLALYRMPDATVFSVDVAVAKARNVTYYASADLKLVDQVDSNDDGVADVPLGVAFTNRTFRYLAEPRFPSGIDAAPPGPFSTLLVDGVNPLTAENLPGVTPAVADFNLSVLGFDAFNPGSNFQQGVSPDGLQNGIVFFPGSTPLFRGSQLLGGLGVSGDGVDQDDVVTFVAAGSFLPRTGSPITRADQVYVDGVRLPYQKFLRNPHG